MIVSVIVCTRNRGALLEATLHSILGGTRRPDELLIVDQSDGVETRRAAEAVAAHDAAVRYVSSDTRGLSRARNVGLEQSRGDVLAFTDDDVLVHPDWLERVAAEFETYPRLAFLFGTVLPPEGYDWRTEMIPHRQVRTRRSVRWFQHESFGGMGANMALRRTAYEKLGGFDAALGAGTGLAGEDHEYALRCLCHRPPLDVHLLDEARVVHHAGARTGVEYHKFVHQVNGTGMGQFLARLCFGYRRPRYAVRAVLGLTEPLGGILGAAVRGRKPSGLRTYALSLLGFAGGAARALGARGGAKTAPAEGPVRAKGGKVLLLGTGDVVIGGTEQTVCRLARALSARGHSVEAVFPETPKSDGLRAWGLAHGVALETTPALRCVGDPHGWRDVLALSRFLRRHKPDVVNLHYGNNFIALKDVLAVRLAGVRRCYVTIHQAAPWETVGEHKRQMTARASKLCDRVIGVCDATRALLLEAGVAPGKVQVLYCGFEPPSSLPPRSEARRRLGLDEGAFVVVTLAGLIARKGIADLVAAMGSLPDPGGRLRLVIGGDGPERASLEAQAASALGPRAVFLGQILGSTADLYAAADAFALPSYQEGLPAVYLEAAFHGVPSVGTRVGGNPEAILDGETGLLVPSGDPAALAAAIGRLRDDPALGRRLGEAARARALTTFTDAAMAARYESLFFGEGKTGKS